MSTSQNNETSTEKYIRELEELKPGNLGLLRSYAGKGLDESVDGFDLFAGLWWPLRQKNQRAPRREVAWLIAKLYAFRPLNHNTGSTLASQLGRCKSSKGDLTERFDKLLTLPISQIEPMLQWALNQIAKNTDTLDWVKLTDDLSIWEREKTRLKWAEEYLNSKKGEQNVD